MGEWDIYPKYLTWNILANLIYLMVEFYSRSKSCNKTFYVKLMSWNNIFFLDGVGRIPFPCEQNIQELKYIYLNRYLFHRIFNTKNILTEHELSGGYTPVYLANKFDAFAYWAIAPTSTVVQENLYRTMVTSASHLICLCVLRFICCSKTALKDYILNSDFTDSTLICDILS